MMRQIKKQAPVFVAILFLSDRPRIGGYILSEQPSTCLAVTCAQRVHTVGPSPTASRSGAGQTVELAGVRSAMIALAPQDVKAVVELKIKDGQADLPRLHGVAAPKTASRTCTGARPRQRVRAHPEAGRGRGETLPDVTSTISSRSSTPNRARTPDPPERGRHGLRRPGHGRDQRISRPPRRTCGGLSARAEPRARQKYHRWAS